jgi:hypothetical protein
MAVTAQVSPTELARVSELCYEGNKLVVMLCNLTDEAFNASSTFADWETIELPGVNGYSRFSALIPAGGYDANDLRFEIGAVPGANEIFEASWTAVGTDLEYNRVVVAIAVADGLGDWNDPVGIHSLYTEIPSVVVFPTQFASYRIQLLVGP